MRFKDTDLIEIYNKVNNFGRVNGMKFIQLKKGIVEYHVTIKQEHLATTKAAHGGFVAGFMDAVLGVAALSSVALDGKLVATVEFKINYLKPVFLNDELKGIGNVINKGNRLITSEGKIYNQKNELIAIGNGTFNAYPFEKSDVYKYLNKNK
ncbi:MAG: hypothetical protein Kow0079_01930 [Vicingaceae bacterium]